MGILLQDTGNYLLTFGIFYIPYFGEVVEEAQMLKVDGKNNDKNK